MELTKYKIGELIEIVDERNNLGIRDFYGINIKKEFMPTVANTEGLDETKYKVVRKNRFVYSGMQTGRDECIRVSMYNGDVPILVSPAYTMFEVIATNVVNPLYFFIKFLSNEMDRYGAFCSDGSCSDGSIRSNLDWDVFCDIELELPPLSVQQKYIEIYNTMNENQKNYEYCMSDLKLSFELLIDMYSEIKDVQGINITKQFMPSVANINGVDLSKYKIVRKGQFVFSGMQTGRDKCIRIALFDKDEPVIISPAYTVLEIKDNSVLMEYIMMWFLRKEVDRLGWFMSDGSIRTNLDMDRFYEIEIPVPDLNVQKSIVQIYNAYNERRDINEKLKEQIKDICPILIKGSIEEARKAKEA